MSSPIPSLGYCSLLPLAISWYYYFFCSGTPHSDLETSPLPIAVLQCIRIKITVLVSRDLPIGNLSNHNSNGSKGGKKAIGLDWQKTTLHVRHTSLPLLHYNDVKCPNFKFYWQWFSFSFSFCGLIFSLIAFNSRKLLVTFDKWNWVRGNKSDEFWNSANSLFNWCFHHHCHCGYLTSLFW